MNYCYQVMRFFGVILLGFCLLSSCQKDEPSKEPPIVIDGAEALTAYPGMNRITLSWEVKEQHIAKAVAYIDAGDSVVVPYNGQSEMQATFGDLEDGNYSFSVYLYDEAGHASSRAKLVTRVYGERYIQSLSSRRVDDALFNQGNVLIAWADPEPEGLGTEVRYVNTGGDTLHVFVDQEEDSTVLTNYKPGTAFAFRSIYKPVPAALDSFYAPYTSSASFSTFSNPLLSDRGADPWVVYKDGMYYFTYTQGGGITLYATKKMSELSSAEAVEVWRPESGTAHSKDLWAPELHYIDNKWYVYVAADDGQDVNHRMYVIENSSADPLSGQWVFKGALEEPSDNWAIDGTPLQYNGQLYMIWSGKTDGQPTQSLYIAKMSNPYTLEGSRIAISTPEYAWEKNGSPINEGPQILKNKDGAVFVVYSASGFWTDDYCLGQLALKEGGDPLNPADWQKQASPVFERLDQAGTYAPGHCSFFRSRDGSEDWLLYHARSLPNGGSTNHRNPRMQQFTWNADGSPDFGEPVPLHAAMPTPSGEF